MTQVKKIRYIVTEAQFDSASFSGFNSNPTDALNRAETQPV